MGHSIEVHPNHGRAVQPSMDLEALPQLATPAPAGWRENLLGIPACSVPAEVPETEKTAGLINPPSVLRGVKRQEYALDWLRVVAKRERMDEGAAVLRDQFGEPTRGKGLHGLSCGFHYASDVKLAYPGPKDYNTATQAPAEHVIIEIPGSALRTMSVEDQFNLAMFFMCRGWHCTRFDGSFDFFAGKGGQVGLIATATAAAYAGELCRAKTFEPREKITAGQRVSHGVTFGQRGRLGSGRYVRIYDKGLETMSKDKTAHFTLGEWERWETEFSGEVAHETLAAILGAKDRPAALRSLVFGAVEFREKVALKDNRASRRPFLGWYAWLLDGSNPVRVRQPQKVGTLDSWCHWYRTCVLPRPASFAAAVGFAPDMFFSILFGEVRIDQNALTKSPVGAAVCEFFGRDFNEAHTRLGHFSSILDKEKIREVCYLENAA